MGQTPKDDLLYGIESIADFIGLPYDQAYRLIANGAIPAGNVGPRKVIASKRKIAAALDRITEGRAA